MTLIQSEPKKIYIRVDEGRTPGANTVLYLPLEGDVVDKSGNNRIFTVLGNSTSTGTPVFDTLSSGKKVAVFDGNGLYNSSWFAYADNSGIPNSGNMTLSFYVMITSSTSNYYAIVDNRDNSGFSWMSMINPSGRYLFHGSAQEVTNLQPTLGTWYNVVNVVDSGTCYIYVNGQLLYNDTYTYGSGNSKICLGGWYNPSKSAFREETLNGKLSEVIVEDKARTAQEVSDYFNATKGNYGL